MWGLVIIIWIVAIIFIVKKISNKQECPQDSAAFFMAVSIIEQVADILKDYVNEYKTITMWKLGETGEGFIIEFYMIDAWIYKGSVMQALDSCTGLWQVIEDDGDLTFRCNMRLSYNCSWNKFNKDVWNEIKTKHPNWKVDDVYPHKSVLKDW